jgi:nitrate/nitrite-specific signal transduction histidine kinase
VGLVRDRDLSGHLFHIAREAVDYAMRRHQPSEISITVKAANRGGVLAIRDNGNGVGEVDLRDVSSVLMQTHAILIDAELECARSPQGGNEQTCVFRIPGS